MERVHEEEVRLYGISLSSSSLSTISFFTQAQSNHLPRVETAYMSSSKAPPPLKAVLGVCWFYNKQDSVIPNPFLTPFYGRLDLLFITTSILRLLAIQPVIWSTDQRTSSNWCWPLHLNNEHQTLWNGSLSKILLSIWLCISSRSRHGRCTVGEAGCLLS